MFVPLNKLRDCFEYTAPFAQGRYPMLRLAVASGEGKTSYRLEAYNGEQFAIDSFSAEDVDIPKPFEVCLPVEPLKRIMGTLDKGCGTLEFDLMDEAVEFRAKGVSWRVAFKPATDMPSPYDDSEWTAFPFWDRIANGILRCLHAVSTNLTKPNLCGVFLDTSDPEHLTAVATDTHRLAFEVMESNVLISQGVRAPSFILPDRVCRAFKSHALYRELRLRPDGKACSLRYYGRALQSPLIDVDFPEWRRIIPEPEEGKRLTVHTGEMLGALKCVNAVATTGATPAVRLTWRGGRELELRRTRTNDAPHSSVTTIDVEAAAPDAEARVEVLANSRYLEDLLESFRSWMKIMPNADSGEYCDIYLNGPDRAMLFASRFATREIVMPMRAPEAGTGAAAKPGSEAAA